MSTEIFKEIQASRERKRLRLEIISALKGVDENERDEIQSAIFEIRKVGGTPDEIREYLKDILEDTDIEHSVPSDEDQNLVNNNLDIPKVNNVFGLELDKNYDLEEPESDETLEGKSQEYLASKEKLREYIKPISKELDKISKALRGEIKDKYRTKIEALHDTMTAEIEAEKTRVRTLKDSYNEERIIQLEKDFADFIKQKNDEFESKKLEINQDFKKEIKQRIGDKRKLFNQQIKQKLKDLTHEKMKDLYPDYWYKTDGGWKYFKDDMTSNNFRNIISNLYKGKIPTDVEKTLLKIAEKTDSLNQADIDEGHKQQRQLLIDIQEENGNPIPIVIESKCTFNNLEKCNLGGYWTFTWKQKFNDKEKDLIDDEIFRLQDSLDSVSSGKKSMGEEEITRT